MILLVPYTPEVPKRHAPRLWPGLLVVLVMGIAYLNISHVIEFDKAYVDELQYLVESDEFGRPRLRPEGDAYLKLRPLLSISPSKGDWDLKRLFMANFVHGSHMHLLLNLIGVFAGIRICSTFLPLMGVLALFTFCGSVGLYVSMVISQEVSDYIPHVGASAGIFALMGAYYVHNFRFRTRYFFWFPSRHGAIPLKTSWFFFVDVILMEIVLSTAQFFPNRVDSVDHVAHVVGFISGALIAWSVRQIWLWPTFIQTREEFKRWVQLRRNGESARDFHVLVEMLEINPYNDALKLKMLDKINQDVDGLSDAQLDRALGFLSPTFMRLNTPEVATTVKRILSRGRDLPMTWLTSTPYDNTIRIARYLTESQTLLLRFVTDYQSAHPERGPLDRKLELLVSKLQTMVPARPFERVRVTPQSSSSSPRRSAGQKG